MSDPVGDSISNAAVTAPPDLIGATLGVRDSRLDVAITFAPGTLSNDTIWLLLLDVDENPSTGVILDPVDRFLGTEYVVSTVGGGALYRTGQSFEDLSYVAPVVIGRSNDRVSFSLGLNLLKNDDGRLAFRILCSQVSEHGGGLSSDIMPDLTQPAGVLR